MLCSPPKSQRKGKQIHHDVGTLTKRQKVIGICLLLFYLAMIAVTIATLPYVSDVPAPVVFEKAIDAF